MCGIVQRIPLVEVRVVEIARGVRALGENPVTTVSVPGPKIGVVSVHEKTNSVAIAKSHLNHISTETES